MKELKKELSVLRYFVKEVFSFSGSYVFISLVSSVLSSILPLVNIVFPKLLIDELSGEQRINSLIVIVAVIVFSNFTISAVLSLIKRFTDLGEQRLSNHFQVAYNSKLMNVSYEKIEDPAFIDLKERALYPLTMRGSIRELVAVIPKAISLLITLVGTVYIIMTFDVAIILLMVVMVAVNIVITGRFQKKEIAAQKETIRLNKNYNYYLDLVSDPKVGLEERIYNFKPFLLGLFTDYNHDMKVGFKKIHYSRQMPEGLKRLVGALQGFISFFYVARQTITGGLSLGQFSMYISAAAVFNTSLFELFGQVLRLREHCRYLEDFMELGNVEIQNLRGGESIETIDEIRFENISFKYPKTENYILKNINMIVNPKQSISIVGRNGTGKTTLIKLLTGLYEPSDGKILLNGKDIKCYSSEDYRKKLSVVFQDFQMLSFNIAENLSFADEVDIKREEYALKEAGVWDYINSLPNKTKTHVGKQFDETGTDFSGGQMQKLAIARAVYRDSELVILDEPTAALDPLAEAEIYEKFESIKAGKMAIYISHRLSSCKFSDRIIYLENGEITEDGSHDELIRADGAYAEMFNLQASALLSKA